VERVGEHDFLLFDLVMESPAGLWARSVCWPISVKDLSENPEQLARCFHRVLREELRFFQVDIESESKA